jgi:hypothetical protein
MRLNSWSGWAALATAAVVGYLTSEAVHGLRGRELAEPMIGFVEESEFVDRGVPGKLPTLPAEEIDLTCLQQNPPAEINRQTTEPPLADGPEVLRAIEYRPDPDLVDTGVSELPPPPPRIPYLTDDYPPPAIPPMPAGDDAANAYPVRQCSDPPTGPIWEAVAKFFGDAAKSLPAAHVLPGDPLDNSWDARWLPMCEPDATNPNLGKPPIGVMQPMPEIGGRYPCCPEKWAATGGRPNS